MDRDNVDGVEWRRSWFPDGRRDLAIGPDRKGRPLGGVDDHGEHLRHRLMSALDADSYEPSESSGNGRPDAAVSPTRHRSGTGFPPIVPQAPGHGRGPARRVEGCERAPGTGHGSSPAPHHHSAEAPQVRTFEPATVHCVPERDSPELPGTVLSMSRDGLRELGTCPICNTRFRFDLLTVLVVSIDPGTHLPAELGGTDPQRAVEGPLCRVCVDYRVPFQRAAYAIKPREAWLAQAHTATVALEEAEASTGRRVTSDAELCPLDPTAFHDLIEALHALEIDTGFRVSDELMELAGLTRLDTGWDIPDQP